ncbi:MAG: helix-turn-helix transcriptional regulator [Oscillospiraceae bacterium]|nr:helix-turn-helix transcriptional regulator [Oscillospiraceae bacterium]
MTLSAAVRHRLKQLCDEQGISVNRLAYISAVPPSSLKNILYGKSESPKVKTIKMLCDGMGITLSEFFTSLEFDNLEQEVK